ncbi:hypothetical protein JHK82_050058 [Glycine max]|nr:hypothetical protein JHK82_050058 [Glycine max]
MSLNGIVKSAYKRNKIEVLFVLDGHMVMEEEALRDMAMAYFRNLFSMKDAKRDKIEATNWKQLLYVFESKLVEANWGHNLTKPGLTGALKGQALPNILFLTRRGLSVTPNCLKLFGKVPFSLAMAASRKW